MWNRSRRHIGALGWDKNNLGWENGNELDTRIYEETRGREDGGGRSERGTRGVKSKREKEKERDSDR